MITSMGEPNIKYLESWVREREKYDIGMVCDLNIFEAGEVKR